MRTPIIWMRVSGRAPQLAESDPVLFRFEGIPSELQFVRERPTFAVEFPPVEHMVRVHIMSSPAVGSKAPPDGLGGMIQYFRCLTDYSLSTIVGLAAAQRMSILVCMMTLHEQKILDNIHELAFCTECLQDFPLDKLSQQAVPWQYRCSRCHRFGGERAGEPIY
jgi:hypothetical protein